MMLALVLAVTGLGVLQLDKHPLSRFRPLPAVAAVLFICALFVAVMDQAG